MIAQCRFCEWRRLAAAAILMVLAGCGGGNASAPYTDEPGNFRVLMIGSPKRSEQKVASKAGELNMQTIVSLDRHSVDRSVIYSEYPAQFVLSTSPEAMLDGAVRGMGSSRGWTLQQEKRIELDRHPGREVQFSVDLPGVRQKGVGKSRLYLVGNRLYQTIILGLASKVTLGQIDEFLDSFALLHSVAVPDRSGPRARGGAALDQLVQAEPAVSTSKSEPPAPRSEAEPPQVAQAKPEEPKQFPALNEKRGLIEEPGAEAPQTAPPRVAQAPMPDTGRAPRPGAAPSSRARSARPARNWPGRQPSQVRNPQVGNAGPNPTTLATVEIDAKPGEAISHRPEPNGELRNRFRDMQKAAVLVGARVGYIDGTRDMKVGMIQPIFQSGRKYIISKAHGKNVRHSITVVARPGYAVGAINMRQGLFLDAFQFVFMKYEDGHLNPDDSYESDWLGDPRGGGDDTASGDGSLVVGIHGRTSGRQVDMLGLVVAEPADK
jgi:hypothetical protein